MEINEFYGAIDISFQMNCMVKWSVALMDHLGTDILLTLWMKGQVLHFVAKFESTGLIIRL